LVGALPVGLGIDGRDGVRSPLGDAFAAAARERHVPLVPGREGMVVRAGPLELRILSPRAGPSSGSTGADPNQRAIVAEASVGGAGRVLLTADAESDVLAALDLGTIDVLKVSHHGSADPGLPALLRTLRPLVAGIEVGARNTYGHPAAATLSALRGVPRTVRTDLQGSVRLDYAAGRWTVAPERPVPRATVLRAGGT
ncbi:MAG: fold metallo-hydrolase, partial [Solirubrobacterales bacterium]|nr:fold metallo-hydrolase [Solirubrobacterales bacterium]